MPAIAIPKLEIPLHSDEIIASFLANIETWEKRVQSLVQEKEREKSPTLAEELEELKQLSGFLKGRLTKRLLDIKNFPEDLRQKYLRCLEPFYTEEAITRFMGHYYDVEVFKQVRLRYRKKQDFEKEVNVLFDLYKVKKTIETIMTLQKSVDSNDPFASQFPKNEQAEFLNTLKEIFKLFFLRFVKKEYRKMLFHSLSESKLEIDSIIEMRKSGISYIQPEVFKTNEYRDKFITVFFSTLLRTKTSTEIKDLHFNYLNFELLKNEFLTDWMQRKLKNNTEKDTVLQNYKIGAKSVAQLIKENPEKETEILSSVPLDIFNDMAEELNHKVKEKDKTPVSTFSKNHGVLARIQSSFIQVKQIARFTVEKMEEMKPKSKIWTVRKKPIAAAEAPKVKEEPKKEMKLEYGLEVLKMEELDFPFFDKRYDTYKPKLDYFRKKVGTEYDKIRDSIWKLFTIVSREHFIIRRDPCHEWVLPLLFSHEKKYFLLIIGTEISQKDQQTGYQSKFKKSLYELNCFYAFATQSKNDKFGKIVDQRLVRKIPFMQYSHVEKSVHDMASTLIGRLFQSQDKSVFKSSNLKLRKPGESFAELDELKTMLGLDENNQPLSAEEKTVTGSQSPETINGGKKQVPEEKPKVQDIRQVAAELKKEMEEAKKNPPKPEDKKPSNKAPGIAEIAAILKKEMLAEKEKKQEQAANSTLNQAPQKAKDIRQVARDLKQELQQAKKDAPLSTDSSS
ncbi:hypothetical protein KJ966_00070 [bacterium]|nr:hypothetical protein [bacterium]